MSPFSEIELLSHTFIQLIAVIFVTSLSTTKICQSTTEQPEQIKKKTLTILERANLI